MSETKKRRKRRKKRRRGRKRRKRRKRRSSWWLAMACCSTRPMMAEKRRRRLLRRWPWVPLLPSIWPSLGIAKGKAWVVKHRVAWRLSRHPTNPGAEVRPPLLLSPAKP